MVECLTKWFWVRVQLQSLKLQNSRLIQARSSSIIAVTFTSPESSCSHLRNAFSKYILTYAKLTKAQLIKMIPSGGFFRKALGNVMGDLGKNALLDLSVPLAKGFCLN